MANAQELSIRDKKELVTKDEKTIPGRVDLENNVLRVDGKIGFTEYEAMEPVYTEYNVGHYTRSFTFSNKIDQEQISAQLEDGVLTLTLPKIKDAQPKRIAIN